jgi:hypothetical protein
MQTTKIYHTSHYSIKATPVITPSRPHPSLLQGHTLDNNLKSKCECIKNQKALMDWCGLDGVMTGVALME